jgi:hypothetical protein
MSSIKQAFKRKYVQWVVEQSMPLTVGEAETSIDQQLVVPDLKALTDIMFYKKVEASNKLKAYLINHYFSVTSDH